MNDEIKEINITFPGQILDYVDTKEHLLELFNYITNLQEEVKEANENAEWWSNRFNAVERDKKDYKSRIVKVNKYLKDSGITFLNLAGQRCFCNNNCADKIINILNGGDE